jgi:hypothetical protein
MRPTFRPDYDIWYILECRKGIAFTDMYTYLNKRVQAGWNIRYITDILQYVCCVPNIDKQWAWLRTAKG